jgi:hypothetical protein
MKRKTIARIHIAATIVAAITIATFFSISLVAELSGEEAFRRKVKEGILYSLPLMIVAMPILNISGNKLASKSQNPTVLAKRKRMKIIVVNGLCLISLACFLYYRSHYGVIDRLFHTAQILEFALGLTNLVLIVVNAKNGLELSGRLKKTQPTKTSTINHSKNKDMKSQIKNDLSQK